MKTLVDLSVAVHKDCKLLKPTARTWSARSLTSLHVQVQFQMCAKGKIEFRKFQPTTVLLHYRDLEHYAEMLEIEGEMEKKSLHKGLLESLRFSLQIDGSL